MPKKELARIKINNPVRSKKKKANLGNFVNSGKYLLAGLITAGLFSFVLYVSAVPPEDQYILGTTSNSDRALGETSASGDKLTAKIEV